MKTQEIAASQFRKGDLIEIIEKENGELEKVWIRARSIRRTKELDVYVTDTNGKRHWFSAIEIADVIR